MRGNPEPNKNIDRLKRYARGVAIKCLLVTADILLDASKEVFTEAKQEIASKIKEIDKDLKN